MPFQLETQRLILRPFDERDIEPFSRYRSDPQVALFQGWQVPFSREQAAQFVQEMKARTPGESGQWYQLALELKSSGEMIGDCAFKISDEEEKQAEIGMTLSPQQQSKGYTAEASARLLQYLFGDLKLHRVYANVDPRNQPAIRSLEKLGFRREGHFVASLWLKGEWVDEVWYALLQREWKHDISR
jgi:RimJ/RimL family protein N-acetyltransferase